MKNFKRNRVEFETPIIAENVLVGSSTGQSRPLLTTLTITGSYHSSCNLDDGRPFNYHSYSAVTAEGMHVGAQVKTFKNTDWHNMEWSPVVGTQLDLFNVFHQSMKYEGHYE